MGKVVGAAAVPVALGGGIEEGQVFGAARLQKALLQGLVEGLGHLAGYKAAGGNRNAVLHPGGGLSSGENGFLGHDGLSPSCFYSWKHCHMARRGQGKGEPPVPPGKAAALTCR